MKRNVCGLDRGLRLVTGLVLLAIALGTDRSSDDRNVTLRRVLAGYGAAEFLLINGTLQWCPLNAALGVDTCEVDWPALARQTVEGDERARIDV